jgi:S-formylglutathione hydrolase
MPNADVISRFDLHDPVHGSVPCTAIRPEHPGPLPVCLFLFGGGGSADTLLAIAPLLREMFQAKRVPPMVVACAGVAPFCFYLDDPQRGMRWESLVSQTLVERVKKDFDTNGDAGLVGISMGGYGALKIAFAEPRAFRAVAALAPMVEPSLRANGTPLRNCFHYPPEVPQALLGPERDAALFDCDHPARRAQRNARAICDNDLAIWLDAGSRDACNAHDGTEFLHRTLWQLDIPHEYHLLRDADHVGPTLVPRIESAFAFVAQHLWNRGSQPSVEEMALRHALADARRQAANTDPTVLRRYGLLRDALLPDEF